MTTFEWADVHVHFLPPDQGGRSTPVQLRASQTMRYMPHFRVTPNGELLGVSFIKGPNSVDPGGDAEASVVLLYTDTGVDYSPLTEGASFDVLEGPRRIGRGTILRRYQTHRHWVNEITPSPNE